MFELGLRVYLRLPLNSGSSGLFFFWYRHALPRQPDPGYWSSTVSVACAQNKYSCKLKVLLLGVLGEGAGAVSSAPRGSVASSQSEPPNLCLARALLGKGREDT